MNSDSKSQIQRTVTTRLWVVFESEFRKQVSNFESESFRIRIPIQIQISNPGLNTSFEFRIRTEFRIRIRITNLKSKEPLPHGWW